MSPEEFYSLKRGDVVIAKHDGRGYVVCNVTHDNMVILAHTIVADNPFEFDLFAKSGRVPPAPKRPAPWNGLPPVKTPADAMPPYRAPRTPQPEGPPAWLRIEPEGR